jgi:hypothetical protein
MVHLSTWMTSSKIHYGHTMFKSLSLAHLTLSWCYPKRRLIFKNTEAPHDGTLRWMKPRSSNSWSYSFYSLNSVWAIRYGTLLIDWVPGTKSIVYSWLLQNIQILVYYRNVFELQLDFRLGLNISQIRLCTLSNTFYSLSGREKWGSSKYTRSIEL